MSVCADPDCRAHEELWKLRQAVQAVHNLCDYWDLFSKGESPTTKAIRERLPDKDPS